MESFQDVSDHCVFATPTGERWCNCNIKCEVIICNNPARNAPFAYRTDGAAHHSFDVAEYNRRFRDGREPIDAPNNAAFVRSRYCCKQHCVDFVSDVSGS